MEEDESESVIAAATAAASKKLPGTKDYIFDYLNAPEYKARVEFEGVVSGVPDLGIMRLSLTKAGDLVAADMWLSGELKIEIPNADSIERNNPRLLKVLKEHRQRITGQLSESVESKALACSPLRRDLLTNRINPDVTFIEYDALYGWLTERDYSPGDWMHEYTEEEGKIYSQLIDELFTLRVMYSPAGSEEEANLRRRWRHEQNELVLEDDTDAQQASNRKLRELVQGFAIENARLNKALGEQTSGDDVRALTPKGRKTLYRLIAALCLVAKVTPSDREAVATLEAITRRAGVPVGDDTIRVVLSELPEVKAER